MNRSARIRAFVKANGPCLIGAITDAFKAKTREQRQRIYWAVSVMCRDGLLVAKGKRKAQTYAYVREPVVPVKRTAAEKRARRTEREELRRRAQGIRPVAEYLNEVKQAAAQRRAAREAARAARPAKAPKQRARKPAAPARRTLPTQSIVLVPAPPAMTQIAPPKPRFETSDEWMARTGRTPEVLPAPLALKPWEPLPKQRKRAA